jgi:hypothetical protein
MKQKPFSTGNVTTLTLKFVGRGRLRLRGPPAHHDRLQPSKQYTAFIIDVIRRFLEADHGEASTTVVVVQAQVASRPLEAHKKIINKGVDF